MRPPSPEELAVLSVLAYFDLAFAALAAGAACFAAALTLLGSVITWSSAIESRAEALLGRSVWTCFALGCGLIATACVLVLLHPH